jgi:methionyl-tRNA synthetase
MYVWFDALTNYITVVGYGRDDHASQERFARYWPADVHLIGKEIVRQHAIYWPAFLMAADLPLPKQVVSHGWWLMDGAKMSKSKGNVVRPQGYIERFGLDSFRYFVFREMTFGQDGSFTDEAFVTRYNADLANDLGNLVSRATTMIHRYCGAVVPAADAALAARSEEVDLIARIDRAIGGVQTSALEFQLSVALREIWDLIGAANRYIVTREPWIVAKDAARRAELETALYISADLLRVVAELIRPFMPGTGERALTMLGLSPAPTSWQTLQRGTLAPGTRLGETSPLFPRIEQTVEELQKMSNPEPATVNAEPEAAKISIDDFMKVELRTAKVLAAERVPKSKKLLKLLVDTGADQRTVVAGIAEAYEPEALVGRTVVIVFNLKPATLMGVESNGMVLAASPEGGKPMLLSFEAPPDPGTRVR